MATGNPWEEKKTQICYWKIKPSSAQLQNVREISTAITRNCSHSLTLATNSITTMPRPFVLSARKLRQLLVTRTCKNNRIEERRKWICLNNTTVLRGCKRHPPHVNVKCRYVCWITVGIILNSCDLMLNFIVILFSYVPFGENQLLKRFPATWKSRCGSQGRGFCPFYERGPEFRLFPLRPLLPVPNYLAGPGCLPWNKNVRRNVGVK